MSPLTDHVTLNITRDSVGVQRAGFGVALLLSANASWAERVREYSSLGEVADDFPVATSPEYLAAQALFGQSPHPEKMLIGRAALKPTQRYQISALVASGSTVYAINVEGDGVTSTAISWTTPFDDIAVSAVTAGTDTLDLGSTHGLTTGDGPFRMTNSGGGLPAGLAVDTNYWVIVVDEDSVKLASSRANALANTPIDITTAGTGSHVLRTKSNDVLVATIVDRANQVVGKNFTASLTGASGSMAALITGDAAGEWFSVEVLSPTLLSVSQTHADPGVATDLDAISLERDDWYALLTVYNSKAYVGAAAAWIETKKKIYVVDVTDTSAITVAVAGADDTLEDLFDLAYARTAGAYHPDPSDMMSAAWYGKVLPLDPGSETWKFKTLAGVDPTTLTSTHRANLRARKANFYETVAGVSITEDGTTADGDYIDVQRGLDWLEDDMSKAIFEALAGSPKIPFTDDGVAVIESVVRGSLRRAERRGIIAAGWTVTVPKVADVSTADKAARTLPDVKFAATLQGAIHKVEVTGSVTV